MKSRAYLSHGRKVKNGIVSDKPSLKMAAMGMKVDRRKDEYDPDQLGPLQVEDFMTGLITGRLRCYNVQSFSLLEREYKKVDEQKKDLQGELKNGRNKISRLRKAAGISSEKLKSEYDRLGIDEPFKDYETRCVEDFLNSGVIKANVLKAVLQDHRQNQRRYDELAKHEIFPRNHFYTVRVDPSYDFKRVPLRDTVKPVRIEFDYGPSDGSSSKHYSFDHVEFDTRPLYSADEYQSLIRNASYRMAADDYITMLDKLHNAGVLTDHHENADAGKNHMENPGSTALLNHNPKEDEE